MAYNKVGVTPAEMMEMRRSGMSNRDIAKSLDISTETVRKYIGKQGGHMEGFEAFKDTPPRKKAQEEEIRKPAYQPKVRIEEFEIGNMIAMIDHTQRTIDISCECNTLVIPPMPIFPTCFSFSHGRR